MAPQTPNRDQTTPSALPLSLSSLGVGGEQEPKIKNIKTEIWENPVIPAFLPSEALLLVSGNLYLLPVSI